MSQCTRLFALALLLSFGLVGCSASSDSDPSLTQADGNEGNIGLALSERCFEGTDPECIPVGGQHVMRPSAFEEAAVENAVARNDDQQRAVDITLTDEGAKVLHDLTAEADGSDDGTRLVMKAGDAILAAVSVRAPLSGDQVTLALGPEDDPDSVIALIQGD